MAQTSAFRSSLQIGGAFEALVSEATTIQLVAYLHRPAALAPRAPDFESEAVWWKIAQHLEGHRFEPVARFRQKPGTYTLRQHLAGGLELPAGMARTRGLAQARGDIRVAHRIGSQIMLKTSLSRVVEHQLSWTPASRAAERSAARIQLVQPSTKPHEALTGRTDNINAPEHRPQLAK